MVLGIIYFFKVIIIVVVGIMVGIVVLVMGFFVELKCISVSSYIFCDFVVFVFIILLLWVIVYIVKLLCLYM